jgi:hypothetical protein
VLRLKKLLSASSNPGRKLCSYVQNQGFFVLFGGCTLPDYVLGVQFDVKSDDDVSCTEQRNCLLVKRSRADENQSGSNESRWLLTTIPARGLET